MPGATSGIIFNEARLPNRALTTRDHTIGIVASIKSWIKIPSLTPRNKDFCMEWFMKLHDDGHEDCSLQ